MKVLKRLKRPARITNYISPRLIRVTVERIRIMEKLGIPIEKYADQIKKEWAYKLRYC